MELTLTPDIENAIKKQAVRRGITPERLVLERLKEIFVAIEEEPDQPPTSLADLLNGYIGVIHSSEFVDGGAQMSENTGNAFAQLMMQKRAQDRL